MYNIYEMKSALENDVELQLLVDDYLIAKKQITKLTNSIVNNNSNCESLGNGFIYIKTGEELGVTVKVVGRGRILP